MDRTSPELIKKQAYQLETTGKKFGIDTVTQKDETLKSGNAQWEPETITSVGLCMSLFHSIV